MHGLSTLNRLLGKKNKEVSRSTSNLSKSHSNLESSSQHNKKIPILNNAPFEQTFRVTVYLPKNQLYVERIGAKTKLEKLMNDVCDSKNLSIDKYEFRHPADMSQVFDNDKTIGEVGLNELRMVLKSESRYNGDFHRYHSRPDDIIKYKPSNVAESVSSSEISRSNLKNTSKTSPYSSTNSLNSLDSTGMNSSNQVQQPVAPIRKKKRAAPRPPSENSIPEQEIFSTSTLNVFKEPHSILPRKNFHVSSPQLYNSNINNNNYEIAQKSDSNNNHTELRSISNRLNAITRPSSLHFGSNTEIVKNLPERQRNNSESSEIQNIMRDSGSMQNSLERAKKKNPAPVPPTRKIKPTPSPRTIQEDMKSITEIKEVDEQETVVVSTQKIVGEIPIDNNPNNNSSNSAANSKTEDVNGNVSKVLLNNKSESSLETEGPISIQILSSEVNVEQQQRLQQEEKSKESVKLPVSKVHINHRRDETRSGSEAEEEEEMTVNIYNVTKSVVTCEKPAIIKETNKQISVVEGEQKHVIIEKNNNNNIVNEITPNVTKDEECQRPSSPEWTYTLPAPPIVGNSLDSNNSNVNNNNSPTDQKSAVGNKYFSDFTSTVNDNETILSDSNTTVISAETHIQPIINDRRKVLDDSFIINPNDYTKPSTAAAILDNQSDKSAEVITSDLEDGYLGNNNNSNISNDNEISVIEEVVSKPKPPIEDIQRSRLLAITRSDSFHSIGQQKRNEYYDGMIRGTNFNALLPQRSTSFLSLVHSQKAEMRSSSLTTTSIKQDLNVPYNRQKSTSELSISDVPSLQSLEVIKNILNCRKNSLQDVNRKNALSNDINNDDKSGPIEEPKNIIRSSTLIQATETALTSTTSTSKIEVKSTEKVIYNTIEKRDIKKLETQKSEPAFVERNKNNNSNDTSNNNNMKKSETQQQWRYSGPPKINFSTWNERPKVEVSVMSDEDYIFGGSAHSTTLPRDFKNQGINQYSQNQNADSVDSYVKKSYSTVMVKNENKEAERHLPKVLGVEYKKDVVVLRNNNNNSNKDTTPSASSSEITNRNNGNNTTKTLISIKQRPATMDYSSAISSSTTKTTLNSPNYQNQFVSFNNNNNISNSKKFTPIVHGFSKLDNISETQSDVKSLPITNKITDANNEKRTEAPMIPVKPSYLRSSSANVDMNRNLKVSSVKNVTNSNNNAGNDAYDENPYSQTLRRTGLIEKMLNNDKKTESIFGRVLDKPKSTANVNPSNNSVQMNEETQVEKVTIRQLSQPLPSTNNPTPPPPPPMIFRKSAPAVVVLGSDINEGETRNQLLDAIKNFNKDSLRRK